MASESIVLNIPSSDKAAPSAPDAINIPLIQNQQQEGQAIAQKASVENNHGQMHPPSYSAISEIPAREGHSPPEYSLAANGVWIVRIPKFVSCPSASCGHFPIYSFLVLFSVSALLLTIVSTSTTAIFSHQMPTVIVPTTSLIVTVRGGYWQSCIVTPDSDYPPATASTQCTMYSENGISHEASWQRVTQSFSLISAIAAGFVCLFIIFSPFQTMSMKKHRVWQACLGLSLLSGCTMLIALLVCRIVGPAAAAINIVLGYGGILAAVSIGLQAFISVSCIVMVVTQSTLNEAWKSCRPATTA